MGATQLLLGVIRANLLLYFLLHEVARSVGFFKFAQCPVTFVEEGVWLGPFASSPALHELFICLLACARRATRVIYVIVIVVIVVGVNFSVLRA